MSEVVVEIVKTEEIKEGGVKYFNINVSNSEVERNPDVVRLHSDAGTLEYVKTDILNKIRAEIDEQYDRVHPYNISCAEGLEIALEILDKYIERGEVL